MSTFLKEIFSDTLNEMIYIRRRSDKSYVYETRGRNLYSRRYYTHKNSVARRLLGIEKLDPLHNEFLR